jgi:hypothetical protein
MTFPQQERLFFKNSWQNDIVPQKGISTETQQELPFFKMMDDFPKRKIYRKILVCHSRS